MITGRADPGGGPEHVFQLTRQLLDSCEVFIAAPDEHPYWKRYGELVGSERLFEIPHRTFSWSVLRRLESWCDANRINVVHSHGRAAGAYARLLKKSAGRVCVHTPHGSLQFKSPKHLALWFAEVLLARRTDLTIAVSRSEREQLGRRLFLRTRLTEVPNGVQIPVAEGTIAGRREHPLRIVHVTRFVPQKNTGLVLTILKGLRDRGALDLFHVDILGDGPERREVEAAARDSGLSAHLTFHGAQDSVAPFLSRAFCFLTTSRWEGMPLAVLEALAAGLPVIASDTPGNNDVVTRDVGRLYALDKPSAAAKAIVELAQYPETWARLSAAARRSVRITFSVERMAGETLAHYQRLVQPRGKDASDATLLERRPST